MSVAENLEPPTGGLTPEEERELYRQEMEIARRHQQHFPVVMALWGLGNLAVWLSLFPLTMMGILPLWAAFIVATINVTLCYLPSHEAQHSNYAKAGEPLRWLNEFIGYVSTIPMVGPFKVLRLTHMEHHAHTNDPELDPDYGVKAPNWRAALWKSVKSYQPGRPDSYEAALRRIGDTPAVRSAVLEATILHLTFYTVLAVLAWSGYALEAALIWWLPRMIGTAYISLYLSWAPHHPMTGRGRYRDTRSFENPFFGNWGALGMENHFIHHLHPGIPLTRHPQVFMEMMPILEKRGVRHERLFQDG